MASRTRGLEELCWYRAARVNDIGRIERWRVGRSERGDVIFLRVQTRRYTVPTLTSLPGRILPFASLRSNCNRSVERIAWGVYHGDFFFKTNNSVLTQSRFRQHFNVDQHRSVPSRYTQNDFFRVKTYLLRVKEDNLSPKFRNDFNLMPLFNEGLVHRIPMPDTQG
ncbi:hypothetical protein ANN_22150 [Periplaneta americana]|uniref:Uncharacterized protein n=1 Tax=Periplaneta americana TaxID=6978 RepID=A0ABQ8S7S2_PERAM|nr:hypothetical protein ANN_22150 [Periplaneta americana]